MFLLMVRVTDPLMPRAMFGLLNTVLYFPSGAVYPQQGFPGWMQAIAVVDPFTYAVHAFKSLLLKNTGFDAIAYDLALSRRVLGGVHDGGDDAVQADPMRVTKRQTRRRGETRERPRPRTRVVETDAATRDRLLATGTRLFAERGFQNVTVRDICTEAAANVAAINYHFEGKAGLYMEVLRTAVADHARHDRGDGAVGRGPAAGRSSWRASCAPSCSASAPAATAGFTTS